MSAPNILIVEDDREISRLIDTYLRKEGYRTDRAADGSEACMLLAARSYHLVILDLMIPEIDGWEVLRRIRAKGAVPVIILSVKGEEADKVLGLGLGADDYLTKPFSMAELIARVKAQLRRYLYLNDSSAQGPSVLEHGDLKLDLNTYEVRVGERRVMLTAKEFEILKLFLSHPGRVFTKAQIFESVWREAFTADENTVMVHIRRLRTKIEPDPSNPKYIRTVWGIGYRLGGEDG